MLRPGFDVRTVQHWMGRRSVETTMRYLAPQKDVHDLLDNVQIAGVLPQGVSSGNARKHNGFLKTIAA
jgi:hypothetical protein